jgi:transposase
MIAKTRSNERPYERFVREYMAAFVAGESAAEVAKRLETTESTVSVYAASLRGKGVKLPRFSDRFDAKFLNQIIARVKKGAKQNVAVS